MLAITNLSEAPLRVVTFSSFACAGLCILVAFVYLVYKLLFWNNWPVGVAPLVIGHRVNFEYEHGLPKGERSAMAE
jgi:polyisoprenyl-phosphate glycosyltransferase